MDKEQTQLTRNSTIEELELPKAILMILRTLGYKTIDDICKQERSILVKSINNMCYFDDMIKCLHAKGFLLNFEIELYEDVKKEIQASKKINFGHLKLNCVKIFYLEKTFGSLDKLCLRTEDSIRNILEDKETAEEIIFLIKYVGLDFATKENPKANIKTYIEEFIPLISFRTCNSLKKNKIYTLEQLLNCSKEELIKIPQFGKGSLLDAMNFVYGLGYSFKDDLENKQVKIEQPSLDTPIEYLKNTFSISVYQCFLSSDIYTLGDLVSKSPKELLKIRGFRKILLKEIEDFLESIGYSLNYSLKEEASRLASKYSKLPLKLKKELISLENIKNKTLLEIEPILSVRAFNCLTRGNIRTVGSLISKPISEISKLKNMNSVTLNEIINVVHSLGLTFVDEEIEPNSLQNQINNQKQENNDISKRIKEKEALLEQYNGLVLEKELLLKREKELDEQIKIALETLKSLGEKDGQKVK